MKSRPGFGGERYETLSFQEKVAAVYDEISDETWITVDANNSIADVHKNLLNRILETIDIVQNTPLGTLNFNKLSNKKDSTIK